MSDAGWGDDFEAAPKKRSGPPTWLWACGCGCLLAFAAVILGGVLLYGRLEVWVEEAADPEIQWPELAQVLPFDERPDYTIERMPWPSVVAGMKIWFLSDAPNSVVGVVITAEGEAGAELMQSLFDENEPQDFFETRRFDLEKGELDLAGTTREVLRFQLGGDGGGARRTTFSLSAGARGAGILVDLGARSSLAVQLMRESSKEPFTDEEVYEFLAPFDLRGVR